MPRLENGTIKIDVKWPKNDDSDLKIPNLRKKIILTQQSFFGAKCYNKSFIRWAFQTRSDNVQIFSAGSWPASSSSAAVSSVTLLGRMGSTKRRRRKWKRANKRRNRWKNKQRKREREIWFSCSKLKKDQSSCFHIEFVVVPLSWAFTILHSSAALAHILFVMHLG